MLDFLTQHWSTLTSLGLGLGWVFDRRRMNRGKDLENDAKDLENDAKSIETLQKIIEQVKSENLRAYDRLNLMEKHFDRKCAETEALIEALRKELDALKKKVNN